MKSSDGSKEEVMRMIHLNFSFTGRNDLEVAVHGMRDVMDFGRTAEKVSNAFQTVFFFYPNSCEIRSTKSLTLR